MLTGKMPAGQKEKASASTDAPAAVYSTDAPPF